MEEAVEVGVDDLVPALEGHLAEGAVGGYAGIVDEHVHGPELVAHPLECCAGGFPVRDIAFRGVHLVSLGAHVRDPAVLALRARPAASDDPESLPTQPPADRRADAAHPARHVSESSRHDLLPDGAVYKVYIAVADTG